MKLNKMWSEAISHLDPLVQEDLIKEAPHTKLGGEIPAELKWLKPPESFVDLGFENLDVDRATKNKFMLAFAASGVGVPGTKWRLRHDHGGYTVVEPVDGSEPFLPLNWKQAVLVMSDNTVFWVGKLVRNDQYNSDSVNPSLYDSTADGLLLKKTL